MLPPTDPTESEPRAGDDLLRVGTGRRIFFEESTSHHLEAALRTDDAARKNYHIRSALQRATIAEANRPE